ncbi:hypothetical protein b3_0138 [Synechococcus phage B3]|nr:hypothetical protein b3_0138 [Synechococcus phage B3]QGT54752.1 hypothetical protein b23_0137 [Synechococcus phage B23]
MDMTTNEIMKNIDLSRITPSADLRKKWNTTLNTVKISHVREHSMVNLACEYGVEQGALAAIEAVIEYLERDPYCHTMIDTGVPQRIRKHFLPPPTPIERLEESLSALSRYSPDLGYSDILGEIAIAINDLKAATK